MKRLVLPLLALLTSPLLTTPASAVTAPYSAGGSMINYGSYLGDDHPRPYYASVGTTSSTGAVIVDAPRGWVVVRCVHGPDGWTVSRVSNGCRFLRNAGARTDLTTPDPTRPADYMFRADATTPFTDSVDVTGRWRVRAFQGRAFDGPYFDLDGLSLQTKARALELTRAVVVAAAPTAAVTTCPDPARSAPAGAHVVLVVCGRNRSTRSVLVTGWASGFSIGSGLVARPVPGRSGVVVLGWFPDVRVTRYVGTGWHQHVQLTSSTSQSSRNVAFPSYTATAPSTQ